MDFLERKSMSLKPRDSASLDYTKCFDNGCVKTRLNELIRGFIAKLALEQTHREALKAKKQFKTYEGFKLPKGKNIEERFGEKARKMAEKVLEEEKKNYADSRAEKDKNIIEEIKRKLAFLVWTFDEEGKPTKLKVTVERVTSPTDQGGVHDIMYCGVRGQEGFTRFRQIIMLRNRLEEIRALVPFFKKDIQKLYQEAIDLASLEYVRKEG